MLQNLISMFVVTETCLRSSKFLLIRTVSPCACVLSALISDLRASENSAGSQLHPSDSLPSCRIKLCTRCPHALLKLNSPCCGQNVYPRKLRLLEKYSDQTALTCEPLKEMFRSFSICPKPLALGLFLFSDYIIPRLL